MLSGVFDNKGERLTETLVAVVYLLVAVAACNGAHLEEADAQYGVVRKVNDKLTDERCFFERKGERDRFIAGSGGEIVIGSALRDGNGFSGVVTERGAVAAVAARRFKHHAPEQLIGACVFKTRAADGHIGQRAERNTAENGIGIGSKAVLPRFAGSALVGDGGDEIDELRLIAGFEIIDRVELL